MLPLSAKPSLPKNSTASKYRRWMAQRMQRRKRYRIRGRTSKLFIDLMDGCTQHATPGSKRESHCWTQTTYGALAGLSQTVIALDEKPASVMGFSDYISVGETGKTSSAEFRRASVESSGPAWLMVASCGGDAAVHVVALQPMRRIRVHPRTIGKPSRGLTVGNGA